MPQESAIRVTSQARDRLNQKKLFFKKENVSETINTLCDISDVHTDSDSQKLLADFTEGFTRLLKESEKINPALSRIQREKLRRVLDGFD